MCQALNLFPAEKYRIPLKDIFSCVQKHTTAPLIEMYHLLKLVVFSYLLGNGDLHAKNISVYESPVDGRIGLTPAYDLICTLLYGDQRMALKMDAKDAHFNRKDFINFATRFELKKVAIEGAIDDVLRKFRQHHHILFSIPMSENRMNFLAKELTLRMNSLSGN
jgi:serine/threonine-protein kinase HipA